MYHRKLWLFPIVFLAITARAQTTGRYPALIHADLPFYPPIARAVHISGTVEIGIVVEKGAVVNAQVKSVVIVSHNGPPLTEEGKKKVGLYLSNPALANIKSWQFDSEERATFDVKYVYQIESEQTDSPEDLNVEVNLPFVKVTVPPLKPIVQD